MSNISRVYTFINDKIVSPVKLEMEIANLVNTWNNHEQGLQTHNYISTGAIRLTPTVHTVAGAYTVLVTDSVIVVNKAIAASTTVTMLASPSTGSYVIVKDGKGDAGSNNVTVSGNGKNIDGSATNVISTNFGARHYLYNGTQWNVL